MQHCLLCLATKVKWEHICLIVIFQLKLDPISNKEHFLKQNGRILFNFYQWETPPDLVPWFPPGSTWWFIECPTQPYTCLDWNKTWMKTCFKSFHKDFLSNRKDMIKKYLVFLIYIYQTSDDNNLIFSIEKVNIDGICPWNQTYDTYTGSRGKTTRPDGRNSEI